MTPRVLNKRTATPADLVSAVYIGRPSKYGNPYVIGVDGTRDEVCDKYEAWALETFTVEEIQRDLRGACPLCWCAPYRCHGDFLLMVANL